MGQNSNFQTSQAVLLAIPQPYKPRNTEKWPASINNRTVLSFSNSTDQKGTRLLDGPKLTLPNLARQYVLQSRNLTNQSTLKKASFNKQSLQFCPSLNTRTHTKKGQGSSMGQNSHYQTSQNNISCSTVALQTKALKKNYFNKYTIVAILSFSDSTH